MADGTIGLGDVGSTRPSRAERRQQAARIAAEDVEPVVPAPSPEPSAPAPVPTPTPPAPQAPVQPPQAAPAPEAPAGLDGRFEARRGKAKVQFTTRISSDTDKRVEWMSRKYGISVTSIAEAALEDILNKSGIPKPDFLGNMPD